MIHPQGTTGIARTHGLADIAIGKGSTEVFIITIVREGSGNRMEMDKIYNTAPSATRDAEVGDDLIKLASDKIMGLMGHTCRESFDAKEADAQESLLSFNVEALCFGDRGQKSTLHVILVLEIRKIESVEA